LAFCDDGGVRRAMGMAEDQVLTLFVCYSYQKPNKNGNNHKKKKQTSTKLEKTTNINKI